MGSLPAPSYATTADLDFNEGVDNVIPVDAGGGSPVTNLFIDWDSMPTSDQSLVQDLIEDYGVAPGSPSAGLPISATAGFQVIDVNGEATLTGGSPSSTATGLRTDQTYTLTVTTEVGSGSPIVFVTTEETVEIDGATNQVFLNLATTIANGLSGAVCALSGGNLKVSNDAAGVGADVLISINGSLFASGDLNGFKGLQDPRRGVAGLQDVFTLNRIQGTPARKKFSFVKLGPRPVGAPGNSIEKAYYNGSDWVRWIDDGAA